MENISARFRNRIRELRKDRDWTQERAAEACGIGYKLYQLYELGVKGNPGLVNLQKIAEGFGLDVSELLSPYSVKAKAKKWPTSRLKKKRRTTLK